MRVDSARCPAGIFYEVLFVSSFVLQGIATCYTSSSFQWRFLTTITWCSSVLQISLLATSDSEWKMVLSMPCISSDFIYISYFDPVPVNGGPMLQLARTWHVNSINFSDTAKRYVSSLSLIRNNIIPIWKINELFIMSVISIHWQFY